MTTLLTPFAYVLTVGTSSVQILPQNPSRKAVMFFNPSSNTIAVCPALTASGAALPAAVNGPGSINIITGGLLILPQQGWPVETGVGAAFNAIASGPVSALTVWEF
jgi:hypothetical protein